MTEQEIYDGVIVNGTTDFIFVAETLRRHGAGWCVVGDFAVNCYVRPVYTVNFDLVVSASGLEPLLTDLRTTGFQTKRFAASICARRKAKPGERASHKLTAQFITARQYQAFVERADRRPILGFSVPVATLADVVRSELWKWNDPEQFSADKTRAQMNLLRLAETHFATVAPMLPDELRSQAAANLALADDGWGEDFWMENEDLVAL